MKEIGDILAADVACTDVVCEEFESGVPLSLQETRRVTLFHDELIYASGFSSSGLYDQRYGTYVWMTSGSLNDEFEHAPFLLAPGTYDFHVLGKTNTSHGMVTWYLNGTAIVTDQDWYSASETHNVIKTVSSISVAGGIYILKGIVEDQNASSSGYYIPLTKYWFERTGS